MDLSGPRGRQLPQPQPQETAVSETISISRAKANLSAAVRRAESGETLLITRHGRPVAALVDADDAERLERLRSAGPEEGLASVAGGWEASDEPVERSAESAREGSRGVPALD